MPGKMNRHAAAAAERKAESSSKAKSAKAEAEADAEWADDGGKKGKKKAAKAQDAAAKAHDKAARKAEKDAFEREEEASMAKPKKMTRYEMEQLNKPKPKPKVSADPSVISEALQDSMLMRENQNEMKDVDASNLRDAAEQVGRLALKTETEEDQNPEKRLKAAHRAYEAKMLPQLKEQNPGLKRSQLKEMCFKQWQKSPENPLVQQAMKNAQVCLCVVRCCCWMVHVHPPPPTFTPLRRSKLVMRRSRC